MVNAGAVSAFFKSAVHESAQNNELTAARHRSYIVSHLLGGLLALAVFPVYLALNGQPTTLTAIVFAWLLTPIAMAYFLSRTGRLGVAHLISAANLTGLVTFAAYITGGISSFLLPWMIVVPLEAALSTDRRVVLSAIGVAGLGLAALFLGRMAGLIPPAIYLANPEMLALVGSASALIYSGGLAVSIQIIYRRSEEAVRLGEQRYRLLAENSTDMITRHDAAGRVLFASHAGEQFFGEDARSLSGSGLFERIHVGDRPGYLTALDRCLHSGQQVDIEFRARTGQSSAAETKSPHFRWFEMRCKPLNFGAEKADGNAEFVAVTRDITARKAQEDELLRARDEAESANRAKTQFLANVSHELRTPLNAIIGFSEILNKELFGSLGAARYKEYAALINDSGSHLLNVVNEILDMSKIEAGKFDIVTSPFEISTLLKPCCDMMRNLAEKKSINVEWSVNDGLPELVADKRACKQMLLNLLSNAIKFTEEHGHIKVTARREGAWLDIVVADNGIGISPKDLPNLGNPFFQADTSYKRNYEGTGLGLSVVKGLARLHGGSLDIASTPGKGTTATIRLPLQAQVRPEEVDGPAPVMTKVAAAS
ncbi:MAG: PAS domain-containing sensor histidine kinase [Pseudomonadota bacterium]|nr:PAS domain-containing sensor histidine kinase [Pseudomonadota bacterium]